MKVFVKDVSAYIYQRPSHAFANEERSSYNPSAAKVDGKNACIF
jgi:dienelactone hydrolase